MRRYWILTVAAAALTCSDSTGPTSIEGSWRGATATQALELVLDINSSYVPGSLHLRDASGATIFNGPVGGPFTSPTEVVVTGARAPSAGGGMVTVDAQLQGRRLAVSVTSTWLPPETLTLAWVGP